MYEFIHIEETDLPFLIEIRNECRDYLHNNNEFTLQECKEWYKKTKPMFYIIKMHNHRIGYIRLSEYNVHRKSIYVGLDLHKKYRGKGFSKNIYQAMYPFLKRNYNVNELVLEVLSHNNVAINLYKNLGFHEVSVIKGYCQRNNINIDSIKMVKKLNTNL